MNKLDRNSRWLEVSWLCLEHVVTVNSVELVFCLFFASYIHLHLLPPPPSSTTSSSLPIAPSSSLFYSFCSSRLLHLYSLPFSLFPSSPTSFSNLLSSFVLLSPRSSQFPSPAWARGSSPDYIGHSAGPCPCGAPRTVTLRIHLLQRQPPLSSISWELSPFDLYPRRLVSISGWVGALILQQTAPSLAGLFLSVLRLFVFALDIWRPYCDFPGFW
jgi:hypothetical protein